MLNQASFQNHLQTLPWFKPGLKIVVACSGGADSIVLLNLLSHIPELELVAVHFDHQLRGAASSIDRDFVVDAAEKLGLQIHNLSEDIGRLAEVEGLSIEEAGSSRRRSAFEDVRKELDYDFVATGQHFDDQVETILLNLFLGTGIQGLAGIGETADKFVRPLLQFKKEDILEYAHQNQLEYRIDETNSEIAFLRNNIRREVIPDLVAQNHHQLIPVVNKIIEASHSLNCFISQSAEHVDIEEFNTDYYPKLALGLTQLPDYFSPIQKAIFDRAFQSISLKPQGISAKHFNALRSLIPDEAIGREYQLPGFITAVRDRSKITMFNRKDIEWSEVNWDLSRQLKFPFFQLESTSDNLQDNVKDPAYFWPNEDSRSCSIRPCYPGDKMLVNDGRMITVSQVLQAAGVAPHLKSYFPVMICRDEIIWVLGVRTAQSAMIQEDVIKKGGLKHCIKVHFHKGTFE